MPQVPVRRYKRTEGVAALPGVRFSSVPAGAVGGPDLQSASRALSTLALEEKRKADEVAVMDADRQLGEFENRTLYDPENGALNKRGKNAFGLPDQVMADYDKIHGEIMNGLANDSQKAAFSRYSATRRRDVDRVIQRHVSDEMRRFDDQATESLVANELQAGVSAYQDPERIAHSQERITYHYGAWAKRNGLDSEWTKRKVDSAVSALHSDIIKRYLANGDDLTAGKYYKANKDLVKGKDATDVENALAEGSVRGESQRQADSIIMQHGQDDSRTAALEKAREIKDPKVRDATVTRIDAYFTNKKTAETEARDKLFMQATNIVDKTGDETKIGTDVWSGLTLGQRAALKEYAKNKRDGTDPTFDPVAWVKFTYLSETDMAKMSDAQFMETYYPKFDKSHRDRALEMLRLARASVQKGVTDPKFATTVTFKDMTRAALESIGIITPGETEKDWSKETARRYAAFETAAWQAVQQYEMSELGGKRPASRQEMQVVMDKLLLDRVYLNEWGRDPEVPAILVAKDKRGNAYVPFAKIPRPMVIEAVNIAKSQGNIPYNMPQAQAEKILAARIERAYGARLTQASRQEILDILGGRR